MKDHHHLEVIYSAGNAPQAYLLQQMLEEEGIESTVYNEALAGSAGGIPLGWSIAPRVLVDREDLKAARLVVERFEAQLLAGRFGLPDAADFSDTTSRYAHPDWPTCPQCGRRRMTVCPFCNSAGDDFPPVESEIDSMSKPAPDHSVTLPGMLPEVPGVLPIIAPAEMAEDAYELEERQRAEEEERRIGNRALSTTSDRPWVICTTCDEPFQAEFYRQCAWCGHDFGHGRPAPQVRQTEKLGPRILWTLAGLGLLGVATIAYLWLMWRR